MIVGVHHLGVAVRSLDAVMPFYRAAAGLSTMSPTIGADDDIRWLAGPNSYVALHRATTTDASTAQYTALNRPGIRHFCAQNQDGALLETAVNSSGGRLIAPLLDLGTGNQYAYTRDPEANIMEIEGLPYAPVTQPTWIGHIAIVTEDMDASLSVFSALLGTQPQGRRNIGPTPQIDRMGGLNGALLEGAWLPAHNMLLEFWRFRAPKFEGVVERNSPHEPGYSHIAFETDDLEGDAAHLASLGGALIENILDLPSLNAVTARTVDGVIIKLVQPTNAALSLSSLPDLGICTRTEAGKADPALS